MSFHVGDRVVATADIGTIPSGSLGDVKTVGASTCGVLFDILPTNIVVAPQSKLQRVGGAFGAGKAAASVFAAMSPEDPAAKLPKGFVWMPPTAVAPRTGLSADMIATTNGGALSLLFDDASVALRQRRRSGAWFGMLEFPVSGGRAKLRGAVRGHATQGRNSQTFILVTVGNWTGTIEIRGQRSAEINETLRVSVNASQNVVPVSVAIVSCRQSEDDETLIVVDSIDLQAE